VAGWARSRAVSRQGTPCGIFPRTIDCSFGLRNASCRWSGTLCGWLGCYMADVAVVGAGIVGASVAYHAARAGAEVVLLERSLPASGVTGDSFAWIGGPGGRDAVDGSTPLRRTALDDHRRLERELPEFRCAGAGRSPGGRTHSPTLTPWAPTSSSSTVGKPVGWNRTCECHRHERWLSQLMGRSTPSP
jgi:FAD dependent oxidoreductase